MVLHGLIFSLPVIPQPGFGAVGKAGCAHGADILGKHDLGVVGRRVSITAPPGTDFAGKRGEYYKKADRIFGLLFA